MSSAALSEAASDGRSQTGLYPVTLTHQRRVTTTS